MSDPNSPTFVDIVRATDYHTQRLDAALAQIPAEAAGQIRSVTGALLACGVVAGAVLGPHAEPVGVALAVVLAAAPDHNPIVGSVVVDGPTDPQ